MNMEGSSKGKATSEVHIVVRRQGSHIFYTITNRCGEVVSHMHRSLLLLVFSSVGGEVL
jgi:hypothetical protein